MADLEKYKPPTPSWLWCLWQGARGTEGSRITIPDVDLRGKWAIISGGNNGIGREAAIRFASMGANIILGCRHPPPHEKHPDVTVADCKAAAEAAGHTSSTIEWWHCDMADLSTLEAFANRWLSTGRPLDILCNNAGMGRTASGKLTLTPDGLEMVHQVNFASHAFLTMSLLPSISRAEDPRIVCTTSCMQYFGIFDLSNINTTAHHRSYSHNKLYFQTWLTELSALLQANPSLDHIAIQGIHPGYVRTGVWTPLQAAGETTPMSIGNRFLNSLVETFGIDAQQGSLAIVRAATAKECAVAKRGGEGGGRYFSRIWPAVPMPQTTDPGCRKMLWERMDEELGLKKKGLLDILTAA